MPTIGAGSEQAVSRYAVYKVVSRQIETLRPPKNRPAETAAGLKRFWQRETLKLESTPSLYLEAIRFKMQVKLASENGDVFEPVEGEINVLQDNGLGVHLEFLDGARRTGEYVALRDSNLGFTGQISFNVIRHIAGEMETVLA